MPSAEQLGRLATETGFRANTLEKVMRLLEVLADLRRHPLLSRVLLLKGGTALNLGFGTPQRLSVDLDFNYIGALDRERANAERPQVEESLERILRSQGYRVQWSAEEHAGRKCFAGYRNHLGDADRIEVDVSYLYREPLLPAEERKLWSPDRSDAAVAHTVSAVELIVGKMIALLDRRALRDLFDVARVPVVASHVLQASMFRGIFIAVSATLPHPLHAYASRRSQSADTGQLEQQLAPMLIAGAVASPEDLASEAWDVMAPFLELSDQEREFVDLVQVGRLTPGLILAEYPDVMERVVRNPAIQWKIQNAARHAGKRRR